MVDDLKEKNENEIIIEDYKDRKNKWLPKWSAKSLFKLIVFKHHFSASCSALFVPKQHASRPNPTNAASSSSRAGPARHAARTPPHCVTCSTGGSDTPKPGALGSSSLAWPPSSDTAPTQSIHGRPLSASAGCSEPCSSAIIACRLHTSEPR